MALSEESWNRLIEETRNIRLAGEERAKREEAEEEERRKPTFTIKLDQNQQELLSMGLHQQLRDLRIGGMVEDQKAIQDIFAQLLAHANWYQHG